MSATTPVLYSDTSALRFLSHYPFPTLPTELGLLSMAVLLGLSLALIFAGRIVVKGVAFVAAGLGAALVGSSLGSLSMGTSGALLGGVLGFIAGGVLSLILLPLGIAFAVGYSGYAFAGNFLGLGALAIVVAGALFVISLILSGKILAAVSTVLGCFILFNLAMLEGLHPLAATAIVVALGIVGLKVQTLE